MSVHPQPWSDGASAARRLVRAQARVADVRTRAWLTHPADPNALHDARVALRRLRVLVRSFKIDLGPMAAGVIRRHLRSAFRATSRLRDLEVFSAWVATVPVSAASRHLLAAADAEAAATIEHALQNVRRSWRRARRLMRSSSPCRSMRTAPRRFGVIAARAVRAEVREVDAGLDRFDPVRAADLAHRTRIAVKRLRYILEALLAHASDSRRPIEWCRAFQDCAGEWHDADAATARTRRCPPLAGRAFVIRRLLARRRAALIELRRLSSDRVAWAAIRRDALAIARRYAAAAARAARP